MSVHVVLKGTEGDCLRVLSICVLVRKNMKVWRRFKILVFPKIETLKRRKCQELCNTGQFGMPSGLQLDGFLIDAFGLFSENYMIDFFYIRVNSHLPI